MSYVESPVETVVKFIPSWRNTHPKRLKEEIVSLFNETNRNRDRFRLLYQNGKILDFETQEPVKIDRSTYVGKKEGEFFDTFSRWLGKNNEGSAVWISPLLDGLYPCNKVTIYQIENVEGDKKVTLNTSILLDTPLTHCLEIAAKLNPDFDNLDNPEFLRNKLFSVDIDFNLQNLLSLASAQVNSEPTPGQETILYFMKLIYSGYNPGVIAGKMHQMGVIGEHAISCAALKPNPNPTFGGFMDTRSFVMNFTGNLGSSGSESGKFVKNCGACGTRIEARISKGYKCSNCGGVYEGC